MFIMKIVEQQYELAARIALNICDSYRLYYNFPAPTCYYLLELLEFHGERRYTQMLYFIFASQKWLSPPTGFFQKVKSKFLTFLPIRREISVEMLQRGVAMFENMTGNYFESLIITYLIFLGCLFYVVLWKKLSLPVSHLYLIIKRIGNGGLPVPRPILTEIVGTAFSSCMWP